MTFGALGDSFYEYLLKVWIQGGRREESYRRMYDTAMDGVDELLVQKVRYVAYLSQSIAMALLLLVDVVVSVAC